MAVRKRALEKLAVMELSLRTEVATCLTLRPASATELAAELEVPVERVRYQLRWLKRAGLIRICERRRRRGPAENVYSADPESFILDAEEWAVVPENRRRKAEISATRLVSREALASVASGAYDRRPEHAIVRIPMTLDAQGWSEAVEVHAETAEAILGIRRACSQRLADGEAEMIRASAVLAHFEVPPDFLFYPRGGS